MAEQAFVGREVEQAQFAALLQELTEAGAPKRGRWSVRRPADADAPTCQSSVVLVHGPGGSGKSRLMRQFEAMAKAKSRTAWLDWARVAAWDSGPGPGAGAAAELGIVKVLGAVQWAISCAFTDEEEFDAGRVAYEFREYRGGADRMPEYVERARQVAERAGRAGFPCSRSDAATLMRKVESAGLAIFVGPRGAEGPGSDGPADAAGPLSAVIAEAVTKRAPGELPPQEYALVTDPATELIRRFAVAVSALAARKSLVIFLDDGELISDLSAQPANRYADGRASLPQAPDQVRGARERALPSPRRLRALLPDGQGLREGGSRGRQGAAPGISSCARGGRWLSG